MKTKYSKFIFLTYTLRCLGGKGVAREQCPNSSPPPPCPTKKCIVYRVGKHPANISSRDRYIPTVSWSNSRDEENRNWGLFYFFFNRFKFFPKWSAVENVGKTGYYNCSPFTMATSMSSKSSVRTWNSSGTKLKEFIGGGKLFNPSEVPTLRSVLQMGILLKETEFSVQERSKTG